MGFKLLNISVLRGFLLCAILIVSCGATLHISAQDGGAPPPREGGEGGKGGERGEKGEGGKPLGTNAVSARATRSAKSVVRGGVIVAAEPVVDTLSRDSVARDSLQLAESGGVGGMAESTIEGDVNPTNSTDSLASADQTSALLGNAQVTTQAVEKAPRKRYFTDSMSLSKVSWTAAIMPGYGQYYNKQAWKIPILYGALAAGVTLYVKESQHYKPLKEKYDAIVFDDARRTQELNELQSAMIRSNTRRQIYLGATVGTYIFSLADAAMNYKTNDVSDVKRATTLATICPGAGQIYNKSYWKVPFVVGGFAAMIYVVDWNNRGYKRFQQAYTQIITYENDPDPETNYPDGSPDEFNGRYSASYMKSLRDSYRRNRDLSIIMMCGLYILQLVDAHVDAHFKEFDVSDDLSMNIEPSLGYAYSPYTQNNSAVFGFNVGFKF